MDNVYRLYNRCLIENYKCLDNDNESSANVASGELSITIDDGYGVVRIEFKTLLSQELIPTEVKFRVKLLPLYNAILSEADVIVGKEARVKTCLDSRGDKFINLYFEDYKIWIGWEDFMKVISSFIVVKRVFNGN